jgi:Domain of unknown function (DUF6647)
MFRSKLFCTAILTLTLAGPAAAQRLELISMPQRADRPVSVDNLDNALRSAADWISNVFGLPEMQTLPAIRRITSGRSALLSVASIGSDRLPDTAAMNYQRSAHEMVAHYDGTTKTIYLPAGWNGSTPAEMSALVHAMAHHFQNVAGKHFDCAEERKALPYEAQERWLGLYGGSLREDFGIDQGVLMLITQCSP